MNHLFKSILKAMLVVTGLAFLGCATTAAYFHTSTPASKTIETQVFSASFEPLKNNSNFFSVFNLKITNKTDHILEIDWNKTIYFHNKKNLGNFVFKGITPSDVKARSVPNETIQATASFSKKISPLSKVALAQRKDFTAINKESGLYAGLLPEGLNSILIAINNNGEIIKKTISVVIKEEEK